MLATAKVNGLTLVTREAPSLADLGVPTPAPGRREDGESTRDRAVTLPPALQNGIEKPPRDQPAAPRTIRARALRRVPRRRGVRVASGTDARRRCGLSRDPRAGDVRRRHRRVRANPRSPSRLEPHVDARSQAGPGIASWAAAEAWPETSAATLVEAEAEMARAGRKLAESGPDVLRRANWVVGDVGAPMPRADLVVASYLIGELTPAALEGLVREAWARSADTLVIIEPGTTAGYRRTLARARRRDHRRWLDPRAVPSRRGVPTPRRRLVPLLGPPVAQPNAPGGEGRRERLRGREVLLRRALSRATSPGGGACAPASRPSPGARRPRSVHADRARAADGVR